jgi:methyl-accepting chemotaxis protein
MKSFKLKIMLPVLVLVALGFAAVTLMVYNTASGIIINNHLDVALSKAEKIVTLADNKLGTWKSEIQMLAEVYEAREMNFDGFMQYVSKRKDIYGHYDTVFIADARGRSRDLAGTVFDIGYEDYFSKGMKGETTISESEYSDTTGNVVILVVAPVINFEGQVIGVVGGTKKLSVITDIINSEKMGDNGYAFMLNSEGVVMAHPDKSLILKENFLQTDNQSLKEIATKMIGGEKGIGYYQQEGIEKVALYQPLKSTDWSVAISMEKSQITEGVNELRDRAIIIGFITILLVSLIISILVGKSLKPVRNMVQATKEVACGNLTARVKINSKDEIGILAENFNNMIEKMKTLIAEMREMGTTVAATSQQITASSQEAGKVSEQIVATMSELAKGATEQSLEIQKGNDMVRGAVTATAQVSTSISNSERLTLKTKDAVEKGSRMVEYLRNMMDENKEATVKVGNNVIALSDKSRQIGKIIDVIGDIAEQTNLLALNAAIEAARAGEQGRGFAVVAEEVRKLAEETGKATMEIAAIIKQIQDGVEKAVEQMESTDSTVEKQENAMKETMTAFEEIKDTTEELASYMVQVSKAMKELKENAVSIGEAIDNIASIAQQSAAGTEEIAASTEEQTAAIEQISMSAENLANMAGKLQEAIEKFRI